VVAGVGSTKVGVGVGDPGWVYSRCRRGVCLRLCWWGTVVGRGVLLGAAAGGVLLALASAGSKIGAWWGLPRGAVAAAVDVGLRRKAGRGW
jgi:hypothetical protein